MTPSQLQSLVSQTVQNQPVVDLHTHLYPTTFGTPQAGKKGQLDPCGLMLWGVDELLTYHYLTAELFRAVDSDKLTPEHYFTLNISERADLVWRHLFIERSPISESCRGVLTALNKLGLDLSDRDLNQYRKWFNEQEADAMIDRVMELANVSEITMTNDVFDDNERARWLADDVTLKNDSRFTTVLRFDALLVDWPGAVVKLNEWGYSVSEQVNEKTIEQVQQFLRDWINRIEPVYCAVSLPAEFRYTQQGQWAVGCEILRQAILPALKEAGLAFAMMIGVTRGVNPRLQLAGDMSGLSDVSSVIGICRDFPDNRFMVTMLARENQHELAVATRKFSNLMLFGCWWFLNNPSLIEEMTRFRTELLGLSYVPQHSDARVLEQLLYKWDHSRTVIAKVLQDKYADLLATNWPVTEQAIKKDVKLLFADNYRKFVNR